MPREFLQDFDFLLQVGAKVWVPSVTHRSSIEVRKGGDRDGGSLSRDQAEEGTTPNAEGKKRNNNAAVVGSNVTVLDSEAGDSSIDVVSDRISQVQLHETEESSAASEVPVNDEAEAMVEPTVNLGKDCSPQSSCLPELPSRSPYRSTRAQLLYLRPEGDTANLQQHNTSVRWNRKVGSQKQSVEASSLLIDGSRIRGNDQFHDYIEGSGDEQRYQNSSGGSVKPKGGEQQVRDCSMEEKHFGDRTPPHCRQQNRCNIGKENQGTSNSNSPQRQSTSSATQCSEDYGLLQHTENRCGSGTRPLSPLRISIKSLRFPKLEDCCHVK